MTKCVTAWMLVVGIAVFTTASARAGEHGQLSDAQFMQKAAQVGIAEVELGELAAQRASDPEVKAFAQRMVDDHSKANDELEKIAKEQGVTLPTELDSKHQSTKERLSKLSGEEFDKAYMKSQVKGHDKVVGMFEQKAEKADDEQLKTWASETLPTLREHEEKAQQLARQIGIEGADKAAGDAPGEHGHDAGDAEMHRGETGEGHEQLNPEQQ